MDPIKVMIVDDENLAVEDLTDLLDWNSLGFSIVATASNGKRALANFRQHRPQLVITDIKMPVMDGIELIREIQKLDKTVKFLLLSAYSEFEYAKEAMRMGVKEYIIKNEITPQSFGEKLNRIRREIDYSNQTSLYFATDLIEQVMNGKKKAEEQPAEIEGTGKLFLSGKYYFVILEEDRPLPVLFNRMHYNGQPEELNDSEISDCLAGYQCESFQVTYSSRLRSGRTVVLVSQSTSPAIYLLRSRLNGLCIRLIHRVLDLTGHSVSAFYFSGKSGLMEAAKSYQNFKERICIKYLREPQGVYSFEDIPADCISEKQPPDIGAVTQAMKYGDVPKMKDELNKLYETIRREDNYACLAMVSNQLYSLLELVSAEGKEKSGEPLPDLTAEELSLSYLNGISHYFQHAFEKAIRDRERTKSYSMEVVRAIEYIKRNFGKETLCVKDIADDIPLSVTRLSVVFKNEVGKTVLNYITDYRIRKAKQMLDEGHYKIYEISEKVGYGSSQYFSQVFTNLVGISPKEYKNRGRSEKAGQHGLL